MTTENPFLWHQNRRPSIFMPKPKVVEPVPTAPDERKVADRRAYKAAHYAKKKALRKGTGT